MTIAFDAIWIPIVISALGVAWSALFLWPSHYQALNGWPFVVSLGILLPACPVLSAWLVWALLT